MKHLNDFIVEKRNFKSYTKYIDLINYKINDIFSSETEFYSSSHIENERTKMWDEDNAINVEIKTWYHLTKTSVDKILDLFKSTYYIISPASGNKLFLDIYDVDPSVLKEFDIELDSKKYNL